MVDRSGFTRHSDVPVAPVKPVEPAKEQPSEQITLPVQTEKPTEEVIEQTTVAPVEEHFNELTVRLVGAVFNTYIILECDDRMLLCDQHAVHERLLYERMMKACEGDSASQILFTNHAGNGRCGQLRKLLLHIFHLGKKHSISRDFHKYQKCYYLANLIQNLLHHFPFVL